MELNYGRTPVKVKVVLKVLNDFWIRERIFPAYV